MSSVVPIYQAACDYADEAARDPGSTLDLARSSFLAGTGEQASRNKVELDALRIKVKRLQARLSQAADYIESAAEILKDEDEDDTADALEMVKTCRKEAGDS